ncbi:MAG: PEGA domain-containing protein [Bacteroidales bacterium]|nr:PEGA domain-containing protein [Bacteroidales bacterium]
MKKFYLFLIFSLIITPAIFTQSFRILSFEEDLSDLSAVTAARVDVNDQKCAIIKVYTNLDGLFFETRLGIEGDVFKKTGEYWIYISPREKMLKIIKSGYIPLEYSIDFNIEESKVYKMTLTGGSLSGQAEVSGNVTEFVVINTQPEGAQVFINDKLKGVSPLSIPLSVGNYNCRLEKALHKVEEFDFVVEAGNTLRIEKNLTELDIFGKITVVSNIEAQIYIDNEYVGDRYYEGKLIEGLHVVKIQAENFKTYTKELLIIANKEYVVDKMLDPKLGVISVQSEPLGASIFIDGEFVGTTPKFVRDVFVGSRELSIEKVGYATHRENITVEYDKTKEFVFKLRPASRFIISTEPEGAELYINNVLIGQTPFEFDLDYTKHNKIKIVKHGYHTIYDEFPAHSELKSKSYNLEKLALVNNTRLASSDNDKSTTNRRSRSNREDRTIIGWSLSGLNSRPGGVQSSIYGNFGDASQYAIFCDVGYQFNNYDNSYIDGIVNFPRFSFGGGYNIWLGDFAVIEGFIAYGREYASGLNWEIYDIWDFAPDMVYTKCYKAGVRAAVRISPHAELFGAYNLNFTDGPAFDVYGDQAEVNGVRYNYQTLFPDRNGENWEIGIRFVVH